jgi:transcriptional regulator with XRE-family HTH domain
MTVQELGNIIQARRKLLRLSQVYVAELAGISARQLLDWEAGRGNPSFMQLQAVLEVIGLTLKVEPRLLL